MARDSASQASSSSLPTSASAGSSPSQAGINAALSQNHVYRHPIAYDKLTGATNNQISEVLGTKQPAGADYPIDHYQQQQQQQQQQQLLLQPHLQGQAGFGRPAQGADFFAGMRRQPASLGPHPLAHQLGPAPLPRMQPPPPLITTQTPGGLAQSGQQLGQVPLALPPPPQPPPPPPPQPFQREAAPEFRQPESGGQRGAADSLPSASAPANNGARPAQNGTQQQAGRLVQQQQQPVYYTPPIFAYNNLDRNQLALSNEPQPNPVYASFAQHQQQPPLGLPEPPISLEEYNARQSSLRQLSQQQQQQQPATNEVLQSDRYAKPARLKQPAGESQLGQAANPFANQAQQQRHMEQMLERQLLFAPDQQANQTGYPAETSPYRPMGGQAQYQAAAAAPVARPPYAHNVAGSAEEQAAALGLPLPPLAAPTPRVQADRPAGRQSAPPEGRLAANGSLAPARVGGAQESLVSAPLPLCARQQVETGGGQAGLANSSAQLPALLCNQDPEYPTKEVMRALEAYAAERSVEQLLPQLLLQLGQQQRGQTNLADSQGRALAAELQLQRQLALDSLQPSVSLAELSGAGAVGGGPSTVAYAEQTPAAPAGLFPSASYEQLCRSSVYLAQPRRAKNLLGQWKVVVNLPGHKYRGIAISQLVRVEECSRPNSECALQARAGQTSRPAQQQQGPLARSRCLQHYENQRLVAWSHQQGLHVDIFRVPISCSCHIRR